MSNNREIWKYEFDPGSGGQFAMPQDAQFVALQVQNGTPCMWWSVPKNAGPKENWPLRTFDVVPTGAPGYVPDTLHYVGTFQVLGGAFVGHLMAWEPFQRVL